MTIYSNILLDRDSNPVHQVISRQRNRVSCGKMSKGYDTYRAIMQMHKNLKNSCISTIFFSTLKCDRQKYTENSHVKLECNSTNNSVDNVLFLRPSRKHIFKDRCNKGRIVLAQKSCRWKIIIKKAIRAQQQRRK